MRKAVQPKRDPNEPIAAWSDGDTTYEVRYTGPGETCTAPHNPKHLWGGRTPSLIITERGPQGIKDSEVDPYAADVWGWLVRLITDGSIDRTKWAAITKTDRELVHA